MNKGKNRNDPWPSMFACLGELKTSLPGWAMGVEEPGHQAGMYQALAGHGRLDTPLVHVAHGLMSWSFGMRPLDERFIRGMAHGINMGMAATDSQRELVEILRKKVLFTLDDTNFNRLLDSGEQALAVKHALPLVRDERTGLYWLAKGWDKFLALGPDLSRAAMESYPWQNGEKRLKTRLKAQWAFLHLPPEQATEHVLDMDPEAWPQARAYMLAELMLRQGRSDKALSMLLPLLSAMPWHVNLLLKAHDLLQPLPEAGGILDEVDATVLLYSWNKADLLEKTIKNLAGTMLGRSRVALLDNGSTDHMPSVFELAKTLFDPGVLNLVRLPINVGAPAARNWLLSLPEVKSSDYAVFLDDDVILPHNWLERLMCHAKSSGADVTGCRITSADPPHSLQSGDYHLMAPRPGAELVRGSPQRVFVFDNCAGQPDMGLFNYSRPALSVSGCCHALSRESLDKVGGFDIRYTPTQFDDLDRDIRVNLQGLSVHYAGDLPVRHIQFSSLAKAQSNFAIANVMGNQIKLNSKYGEGELEKLASNHLEKLWQDLEEKARKVEEALSED